MGRSWRRQLPNKWLNRLHSSLDRFSSSRSARRIYTSCLHQVELNILVQQPKPSNTGTSANKTDTKNLKPEEFVCLKGLFTNFEYMTFFSCLNEKHIFHKRPIPIKQL